MEDYIRFAIARGIKSYGFSSHAPLPFLTRWTMKEDDFTDYQSEFYRLKEKYHEKIDLYLGLEVDYIDQYSSVGNDFFQDKTLDYLIGSIHYVDKIPNGKFWNIDGDFTIFDNGLKIIFGGDIKLAVKRFFEVSCLMIDKGGFDIVGHFDKISFNAGKYKEFDPTDKWYTDLVTEALHLIKEKELILEINTKALSERGITYPHQRYYPLIKDLQIPIVVNSDCHYPTNVIDGFVPTYAALQQAGFRTLHQLVKGKWQAVAFNEKGLIG
jgi:histidinol-phosphatase (PHP family)